MVKSAAAFTAMNAGELSPLLGARTDKDFYGVGLTTCQNMIPLTQGPAAMRSGFQYVKEVADSSKRTALIRFEFGLTQAYIIEVGDLYFRIYKDHGIVTETAQNITGITKANPAVVTYSGADTYANGDKVLISGVVGMVEVNNREFTVAGLNAGANTFQLSGVNSSAYTTYTSGGTVAEIVTITTPYTLADLFDSNGVLQLSYAQSADTLYIAHPSYALRKLTRSSHTSWTLSTVSLVNGPFSAMNSDDTKHVYLSTMTSYYPGGTGVLIANSSIFTANHVGGLFFLEERYFADLAVSPWAASLPGSNALGTQCSYDGNVYEIREANGTNYGSSAPVHTDGEAYDNPAVGTSSYRKWRYLHSRWCVLQITSYTSGTAVNVQAITYVPNGLNPNTGAVTGTANAGGLIRITHAAHGYQTGDYVHIQNVTGTTNANGSWKITVIGTNTYDLDGSTFNVAWAGGGTVRRYATWKWAHGAFSAERGYPSSVTFYQDRLCLAATASDPDTVWMSEASSYESFNARDANQITAANAITAAMNNGDVNKIESMQGAPDGLLVFTAAGESIIRQASTNEPLGPNNYRVDPLSNYGARDVRPIKIGGSVFFVQRAGKKIREFGGSSEGFIGNDITVRAEHLTARYGIIAMDWCQEPDALLWCVRSDGTLLSFTYQKEQNVFAWCRHQLGGYSDSGNTLAPIVESVCQVPSPDGSENELWVIVKRYINGGTKRYIEYLKPRWITGTSIEDGFFVDSGLTYDGSAVTTVSGLNWLIGQSVTILADGKVHPNKTVSSAGTITLDYSASVVQVGLGYSGRIQLPRPEPQQPDGTAQGRDKLVKKVTARLFQSNNLKFGPSFSNMGRVNFRTTTDPIDQPVPLMDGDKRFDFNAPPGNTDGYICLENDYPYPFCVVGVFPMIEVSS